MVKINKTSGSGEQKATNTLNFIRVVGLYSDTGFFCVFIWYILMLFSNEASAKNLFDQVSPFMYSVVVWFVYHLVVSVAAMVYQFQRCPESFTWLLENRKRLCELGFFDRKIFVLFGYVVLKNQNKGAGGI